MISDLRSTNGVQVRGRRIRRSATLADGDHIRIGGHEFTFEISHAELSSAGLQRKNFARISPESTKASDAPL